MKKYAGYIKPRSVIGLGLIAFAILLFLDNIGVRFLHTVFHNWPLALIILGVALLYGPHKSASAGDSSRLLPYLLIGFGLLFFAAGFFHFRIGVLIIPLVLLFVGLHILRSGRHKVRAGNENGPLLELKNDEDDKLDPDSVLKDANKIDIFTILGGGDYGTRSQNLTDGNIVTVLGGAKVDIRDADTAKDVIEIDILAFMGGVELRVPPHWQVSVKALPILGGITNKTTCLADKMQVKKKHLVVTGIALLGGMDIRN
jgi:predicted membrane protein